MFPRSHQRCRGLSHHPHLGLQDPLTLGVDLACQAFLFWLKDLNKRGWALDCKSSLAGGYNPAGIIGSQDAKRSTGLLPSLDAGGLSGGACRGLQGEGIFATTAALAHGLWQDQGHTDGSFFSLSLLGLAGEPL